MSDGTWDGRDGTVVIPYASIERNVARLANDTQDEQPSGVHAVLIEARLVWAGDIIALRHVPPRSVVRVRDLGLDVTTSLDLIVAAEDEQGHLELRLPNGARVPDGWRMTVRLGRTTLRLALVADDTVALPRALPDPRIAFGVIAAAVLHLVLLGLMSHGKEDLAQTEQEARETMQRMVTSAGERAAVELAAIQEKERKKTEADAVAPAPAKERGAAGTVARTNETGRARITRGEERHATRPRREEVETFGLISILTSDTGNRQGSSAFAAETGPSAMGNIFGQTIDDAAGLGGLNLSGAGEGGGGPGGGVPLTSIGNIGTIGHPGGFGAGQGFGCGCGRSERREHVTRAPTIGWEKSIVNGRLPPEAIQRVVRQSFGRLRLCYERGLQHSPDLEGRIAVKFVIDREGAVTMASVAERSLDDASVAGCVAKAYEAMTFPKPEGGIVTVVYPVVFSRTSP